MAVRELSSPPSMRTLYPKAVAGAGRSALRKLPGLGGGDRQLPDTQLVLTGLDVDREHLAAYVRVCGFRLRDELPPTYPHVLAFPLHMRAMTDGRFPYRAVGLVHIENRIEVREPLWMDEPLEIGVRPEEDDREGVFTLVSEARVDGELAWREESTMLRRGASSGGRRDEEEPANYA